MASNAFGKFFKELRIKRGLTLRELCLANGFDPGNLSKIERGLLFPPKSADKLAVYAKALGLRKGSDDWFTFFDLAAAMRGQIPHELLNDQALVARLPILFRTLRGQKPKNSKLDELIERVRLS